MASETTVGSIVGTLRLNADQFHREIEQAIGEADRLDGKKVDIPVKAETSKARAELAATKTQVDQLDRSNAKLAQTSRDTGRGMGALATAIISLGPAVVPLAAATTGLAAGFGAMGTAGILAIVGINREMKSGTAVGQAFTSQLGTLKSDLNALGSVAAKGVLRPFQQAVHDLQGQMPNLTRMIGEFSGVTGKTAGNLTTGLIAAFVSLEPLMRDVAVYTLGLSARFREMMSGPGVVAFGDYIRSVFPQVMQSVEALVGATIHLVQALAPLGLGVLSAITAFSQVISAIPVDVLATLATLASSVFLGFKSWSIISGLVSGFGSALTKLGFSAEAAATGMSLLTAAAAGIGAIVAVATYLYTQHAEAVRQNEQAANGYADALRASNGALDENIQKMAAKNLQDSGALQTARELGINLRDLTQAALGNADAQARVNAELAVSKQSAVESAAGNINAADAMGEWQKKADKLTGAIGGQNAALVEGTQKNRDMAAAMQATAGTVTAQDRAQASLAGRLGATTTALQAATDGQKKTADATAAALVQMQLENDAAGILKGSLDALNGKALSAADAQNAFDSSLANMGDHVTTTGKKITFTTRSISNMSTASVALRGQLNGQVANLQRVVEANGGLANSTGKARTQMVTMRKQIIDNAVAHGVDRAAVTAYIDKLLAIPKKVPPTKLDTDTAAALAKVRGLQSAINALTGKTVNIYTNEHIATTRTTNVGAANSMVTANAYATGSAYRASTTYRSGTKPAARATGGAVGRYASGGQIGAPSSNSGALPGYAGGGTLVGPGSGTSDSIMAMVSQTRQLVRLSNGEFISTAASRRRNRAALEAGNKGATLSTGGGIDYQQLAAAMTAAMSRVNLHNTISAGSVDRAMAGGYR